MSAEKFKAAFTAFRQRLLVDKKLTVMVAAAILGVLLVLFSSFGGEKEAATDTVSETDISALQQELEEKLSHFLENISGAGKVEVMICLDESAQAVYACDTNESSDVSSDGKQEIKSQSEHIIIQNGSDEGGLYLKEIYPKVRGVAIVCSGGADPVIKAQIVSAVSALFDINSTRISVAVMAD